MCGIFGYVLHKKPEDIRLISYILASEMDNRGGDSWGWYDTVSGRHERGLGDIADISSGQTLSEMCKFNSIIGHTRKGTTGEKTIENCHPFNLGDIVGAHNGVVYNHTQLNHNYSRKCTVDSQHIFHHIAENRDMSDIHAYGAIVYKMKDEDSINFCRFNNGSLEIVKTPFGFIFASTILSIKKAVHLAGIDWDKDCTWYKVDENFVYKIRVWEEKPEEFALFRTEKKLNIGSSGYKASHHSNTSSRGHNYGPEWDDNNDYEQWKGKTSYPTSDTGSNVVQTIQSSLNLVGKDDMDLEFDKESQSWHYKWQENLTPDEIAFLKYHNLIDDNGKVLA